MGPDESKERSTGSLDTREGLCMIVAGNVTLVSCVHHHEIDPWPILAN